MDSARITSKGQVTIPKSIRSHLGLSRGDRIVFEPCEHGMLVKKAILSPVANLDALTRDLTDQLRARDVTADDVVEAVRWSRSSSFSIP